MTAEKRNFIFFFPDELRAESLGCYGHPVVQTPNLDQFAQSGTRFEQCHVQHAVCSPSRCSLMTGWYPHNAGHRTLWHLLRPHEPSLFRYLRQAGYRIEWFGKNDLYSNEYFKELGLFEAKGKASPGESAQGGLERVNPYGLEDPAYYSFLYEPSGNGDRTETTVKIGNAIDFLRSSDAGAQPFFLYLPTSFPHPPYAAPQPYHDMYDPDELPELRPAVGGKPQFYEQIREYRRLGEHSEKLLKKIQAVYLGMISHVDYWFGELLKALEESGLADSTTVIVASDHGDWAGDYGLVEKWPSGLDDALTRVPLIIRSPGFKEGHVVREPVELFDIMATVLDLAGINVQHNHFARSLVPQLGGEPGDPNRAVFAEGGYDVREAHCFEGKPDRLFDGKLRDPAHIYYPKGKLQQDHPESVCRAAMIRTQEYKLVRRTADVSELYDLRRDPRELNNVYGQEAYRTEQLMLESRLLDWYIHTADVVPVNEDPRGFPKPGRVGTGGLSH